jgi:hypothetical protein
MQLAGGSYEHIVFTDPALDRDTADFEEKYLRYRDTGDEQHLPLRPGGKPIVFTLRHPHGRIRSRLRAMVRKAAQSRSPIDEAETYYCAAQYAIESVRGALAPDGKGELRVTHEPDPESGHVRVTEFSMSQLQAVEDASGFPDNLLQLVGDEVIRRLFVGPLSKRG